MRPESKKMRTPLKFAWEISTSIHQVAAYEGSPNWACKGCGCCGCCGCCIGCIGCSCIGGWWTGGACCSGCGIGCIGWGIGWGMGCPPWTLAGACLIARVDGTQIKRNNLGGLVWFDAKTQNGFKFWAAGIKTNSMVLKLMLSNTLSRFKNDSTALSLPVHGDLKLIEAHWSSILLHTNFKCHISTNEIFPKITNYKRNKIYEISTATFPKGRTKPKGQCSTTTSRWWPGKNRNAMNDPAGRYYSSALHDWWFQLKYVDLEICVI